MQRFWILCSLPCLVFLENRWFLCILWSIKKLFGCWRFDPNTWKCEIFSSKTNSTNKWKMFTREKGRKKFDISKKKHYKICQHCFQLIKMEFLSTAWVLISKRERKVSRQVCPCPCGCCRPFFPLRECEQLSKLLIRIGWHFLLEQNKNSTKWYFPTFGKFDRIYLLYSFVLARTHTYTFCHRAWKKRIRV